MPETLAFFLPESTGRRPEGEGTTKMSCQVKFRRLMWVRWGRGGGLFVMLGKNV